MAAQPYSRGTFPVQFFGGGISRSKFAPNSTGGPYNNFTGGTVFAGGTLQNNALFDATLGTLNWPYQGIRNAYNDNKPYNGLSLDQNTLCITKSVSAGTFATMVAGQYVMMTFNSQLAGISTTVLKSPGSSYRKSENKNIGWVDTVLYWKNNAGGFYMYNGLPVAPINSRDNIKTETYPSSYSQPARIAYLATGKLATTVTTASKSD